jgi:hypothetical protein
VIAFLVDALVHGAQKVRIAPRADAGLLIGRDVGGVERAVLGLERAPARERRAASTVWQASQSAASVRYLPRASASVDVKSAGTPVTLPPVY